MNCWTRDKTDGYSGTEADNWHRWLNNVSQHIPGPMYTRERTGPRLNIKTIFTGMGMSIMKIRLSWDPLIFIMGIPLLIRRHHYIEAAKVVYDFFAASPLNKSIDTPFGSAFAQSLSIISRSGMVPSSLNVVQFLNQVWRIKPIPRARIPSWLQIKL